MTGELRDCTVVVPTIGRPSLDVLLDALAASTGPRPAELILVDDRPTGAPLAPQRPGLPPVRVVRTGGGGPAAARNLGWRTARTPWIAFLDDDVVPDTDWYADLAEDLAALPADVAGTQGRVRVPLPYDRRPTDWERGTAGLSTSSWITADLAYRRSALAAVGGFDERFPRAFREDSDLALRVMDTGSSLTRGRRWITHPVRPVDRWVSVRVQAGNADDVLMRRLHGPSWRDRADAAVGRRPRHLAVTAAALGAVGLLAAGKPRAAALAALGWAAGTAEFAWARIAPGPRTRHEVARMVATSVAMPAVASFWTFAGVLRWGSLAARRARARPALPPPPGGAPRAVLLDRDGTLIRDVPYNGDPRVVEPMPGAATAVDRLRRAGVLLGVVSNQSGIGRGLLSPEAVAAVNRRVEELLGPLGAWAICPHAPEDRCGCRKPAPGLVLEAAAQLGVAPEDCVVVGDIGADVEAARAAGARAVLVPTPRTRAEEVTAAPLRAADLPGAVSLLLGAAA
jgi:histidinol-phosphate phosphatase family protein